MPLHPTRIILILQYPIFFILNNLIFDTTSWTYIQHLIRYTRSSQHLVAVDVKHLKISNKKKNLTRKAYGFKGAE